MKIKILSPMYGLARVRIRFYWPIRTTGFIEIAPSYWIPASSPIEGKV